MSVITCPEDGCENKVSKTTESCPLCGFKIQKFLENNLYFKVSCRHCGQEDRFKNPRPNWAVKKVQQVRFYQFPNIESCRRCNYCNKAMDVGWYY
jgi:hypothetical protein